jgi:hypothetical protein
MRAQAEGRVQMADGRGILVQFELRKAGPDQCVHAVAVQPQRVRKMLQAARRILVLEEKLSRPDVFADRVRNVAAQNQNTESALVDSPS